MRIIDGILGVLLSVALTSTPLLASVLEQVKKRGVLHCGVSQGLPGFSSPNRSGIWKGIDVDICRGVAAAVLGDSSKVKYSPLSSKERFTALQSGEIDLLSRNTTWTLSRDVSLGVDFAGVTYYDGQGFMVRKDLGVKKAKELDGATICTNLGTTTELNIADFFRANNIKYKLVSFEKTDEVLKAYDAGRCDAYSTDQSGLYAMRLLLKKPSDHVVLDEMISKEPLGPVIRHGDNQWADIVRWTLFAVLLGEEYGITSVNIDQKIKSKNPAVLRLLGIEGDFGKSLGLNNDWAYQIIKQVGNYSQIFESNLGSQSPLGIDRSQNRLWSQGGLHYPMPVR